MKGQKREDRPHENIGDQLLKATKKPGLERRISFQAHQ